VIAIEVVTDTGNGAVTRTTFSFPTEPLLSAVLARLGPLGDDLNTVSVWGHRRAAQFVLRSGDRVEITRALLVDPKQARARKVAQKPRRGWVQRGSPAGS
jgi:hypothetical protein